MRDEEKVAGLYVERGGPYFGRPDVDPWDITRDAKLYDGPWPVVAHPPCGPWSALRHLSRESTADCGPRAIEQARKFGGVVEQPRRSRLFEACGIPQSELVFVDQVSWGHVARKPTALYFVGVEQAAITVRHGGTPTHWCSGGRRRSSGSGGLVPRGIKVCSAQQRRRTPPAFADWLISLAHQAARKTA
jgi:hypothetical protein